jgi:hypothetical protein
MVLYHVGLYRAEAVAKPLRYNLSWGGGPSLRLITKRSHFATTSQPRGFAKRSHFATTSRTMVTDHVGLGARGQGWHPSKPQADYSELRQ